MSKERFIVNCMTRKVGVLLRCGPTGYKVKLLDVIKIFCYMYSRAYGRLARLWSAKNSMKPKACNLRESRVSIVRESKGIH